MHDKLRPHLFVRDARSQKWERKETTTTNARKNLTRWQARTLAPFHFTRFPNAFKNSKIHQSFPTNYSLRPSSPTKLRMQIRIQQTHTPKKQISQKHRHVIIPPSSSPHPHHFPPLLKLSSRNAFSKTTLPSPSVIKASNPLADAAIWVGNNCLTSSSLTTSLL